MNALSSSDSITALISRRQDGCCPNFVKRVQQKRTKKALLSNPRIQCPDEAIISLDIHEKDCRYLLSGSSDGVVSVFDLSKWGATKTPGSGKSVHSPVTRSIKATGNEQNPLQVPRGHSMAIVSARWYPIDSGAFASASTDGNILVWDTNEMVPVARLEPFKFDAHSLPENTVARPSCMEVSSKAGHLVAVGSRLQGSLRLCDIRTGTCSHSLTGHRAGISCVQWSPLSEYCLVSGGFDSCIRLWDIRKSGSGGCLTVLDSDLQPDLSHSRGYLPDYAHLCTRKRKKVLGPNDYRRVEKKSVISAEGFISGLQFTPDGHALVSSSSAGHLQLWDLTSSNSYLIPRRFQSPGGGRPVQRITSASRQKTLVVTHDHVWTSNGSRLFEYSLSLGGAPRQTLSGHLLPIEAVAKMPDTGDLLTSARDGLILAWGCPLPPPMKMQSRRGRKRPLEDKDCW